MQEPVLYDSVSLNHFGIPNRLDILENLFGRHELPRWSETVASEIDTGANLGHAHCENVLRADWLGDPEAIEPKDLAAVQIIRTAMTDPREPSTKNLGEAESLFLARKYQGWFVTDDGVAHDWSLRNGMLGAGRVLDTVDILRRAVSYEDIGETDAKAIYDLVIAAGRDFRSCHPTNPPPSFFAPE